MRIDLILKVFLVTLCVVSVTAFALGSALAKGSLEAGGRRIVTLTAVVAGFLLLGSVPLARSYGTIAYREAGLIACGLCGALLGGYGAGRKHARGQRRLVGVYIVLTVMVLGGALYRINAMNSAIAAALGNLGVLNARKIDPVADKQCPDNLSSLYRGFEHYVDSNGQMPPADWQSQDDLTSAVTKDEWFHCPAVSNRHDKRYGYAYNDALAGVKVNKLTDVPNAARTPLLYDSTDLEMSAHDHFASLPRPGRHGGRNNVLYCDGHVASEAP